MPYCHVEQNFALDHLVTLHGRVTGCINFFTGEVYQIQNSYTVEPLVATTSSKQSPLLGDQFSKVPKVSKSDHYIWNHL